MPPDESLCCSNDPTREMRSWAGAIAEARALAPWLVTTLDALERNIPYGSAEIFHWRVRITLPSEPLKTWRRQSPGEPLVAYIFDKDAPAANAQYCAPLDDDEFEVTLPTGSYCVKVSTKWDKAGPANLGFVRDDETNSVLADWEAEARRDLLMAAWARTPALLRGPIPAQLRQLVRHRM
jgi:hypothetical protein